LPPVGEPFSSFTGAFGGILSFHWAPSPIVVATQLEAAADKLNNMRAPLLASRDLSIADVAENFAGEHDPDGNAWTPWSESYVESGPPGPPQSILNLTGDLEGSATSAAAWPLTTREVFFSFGALPEYGIWHQQGASRVSAGRGVSRKQNLDATQAIKEFSGSIAGGHEFFGMNDLPPRPFAGISVETQIAIVDIFDAWFGGIVSLVSTPSGLRVRGAGGRFEAFGGRV
jgi:hypothetical protein